MSLREPRQIKRPRLSLSCIVCRRRKVRCGREQPECANCVRMKETCVYKTIIRDDSTSRGDQAFSPPQDGISTAQEPRAKDLTWSYWVAGQPDNAKDPSDQPPPAVGPASSIVTDSPSRSKVTRSAAGSVSFSNTSSANLSSARSLNHRQGSMADLTTPSWDEAIRLSNFHEDSARKGRSTRRGNDSVVASSASTSFFSTSGDYLSLRRGARARYIGQAFWGFVAGKESVSDDFFDDNRNVNPDLPPSHISSMGMFSLLQSLPTKTVSDALLEVFFFAVWPFSPLVHCPTLRADYDEFWDWCRNSDTYAPPRKLRDDPTFLCLLFATLYCGASAAPAASWMSASLQGVSKETTVNQLGSAYETSLSLCRHLDHPTFNTLVSTLLTGPFLGRLEPMRELTSISTTIRLAQSIGLHREGSWSALGPVDREIRRRNWWYILRLDVQSSISTGLPPCYGSEALDAVDMMDAICDEEIGDLPDSVAPSPESKQSIALMFAIGCSETARLQSKIVTRLQSGRALTQDALRELVTAGKKIQQNIDTLIARIPSQGIPERGIIPSRLANASPSTHPSLYKDDANEPTVLAAWSRIMLTLLKFDVAILLQKPFLPPPDSSNLQSCKAWTSMAQLCVSYFRTILPIFQTPAFSPYKWFYRSYYGPLQCLFLTITYLHCFKDSKDVPLARYFVDEVIEHTVSCYQVAQPSTERSSPNCQPPAKGQMPLAIRVLVDLHSRLDSDPGLNNDPQSANTVTDDYSALDLDLASIADLDSLSSSLLLD